MKKLVMSALLFGTVAQAAGCIFVSDDSSTTGTAVVNVTWTLLDDTAAAGCPVGGDTATIYAALSTDPNNPYTDIYHCADGAGSAMDLPAGDYTIWVEITDSTGASLYAMSEDATLTLQDGELATADFRIDVANGFFDVSWQLTGGSCATIPNNGTDVLSTVAGTTTAVDSIYNCTDGEAPNGKITTDAVPIGDIVVSLALLDGAGQAIQQSAPINTTIDYGNQFVDLGTVQLQ